MEQTILITMTAEDLRMIISEEVAKVAERIEPKRDLPHFLTPKEARELLRISDSKMRELMGRKDFPVCREFGVKIYTDELFKWIHSNAKWMGKNTSYFRSVS
ncbi:helix-turn-helix domain-containing protein [Planococcus koreensis]|uniref:helix-turn-helix domain-containing protein n=1 Tax=Planococcus koreensis TaxID=112331 RepID=UPI0039FCEE97